MAARSKTRRTRPGAGHHRVRTYTDKNGRRVQTHERRNRGFVSWEHSKFLFSQAYERRRDKPVMYIVGGVAVLELVTFMALRGGAALMVGVAVILLAVAAMALCVSGRQMPSGPAHKASQGPSAHQSTPSFDVFDLFRGK